MNKYSPEILDEELTRHFEEEMEKIREGDKSEKKVLEKAKEVILKTLDKFRKHEKDIGDKLIEANRESQRIAETLGPCNVCKKGEIRIIGSKKTGKKFAACNQYPDCKTTFCLPQSGTLKKTDKNCGCGFVKMMLLRKGKKPWFFCFNPNCQFKDAEKKEGSN